MCRQMLGGSPDATEADPDAPPRIFEQLDEMRAMFELMKPTRTADKATATGGPTSTSAVPADLESPATRSRISRRSPRPTLILTGDRDKFCSVEEGVMAYRMLPDGELAILPNTGHLITPAAIEATIEFFERHHRARRLDARGR